MAYSVHLNRDVIADAAFIVAERAESETLRIRDIGTQLGADPTAIYRHFRSRDELVFDLIDRLALRVLDRFADDPGDWRSILSRGAGAILDQLEQYPAIGIAAARDRVTRMGELRLADFVLATVLRSGVSDEDAVRFYSSLSSFTFSSAVILCQAKVAETASASASEAAVTDAHNRRWVIPVPAVDMSQAPTMARLWPLVAGLHRREVFSAGIESILDAIESRANRSV